MQPIKVKDFQKFMKANGFYLDRHTGSHYIWMNDRNETIAVSYKGKEINPMMWKLIQQRLLRGKLIKTVPQNTKVKSRVFFVKTWNIRKQLEGLQLKQPIRKPDTIWEQLYRLLAFIRVWHTDWKQKPTSGTVNGPWNYPRTLRQTLRGCKKNFTNKFNYYGRV